MGFCFLREIGPFLYDLSSEFLCNSDPSRSAGRDVLLKAIGPAPEVTWEKDILQYLNQPKIREDTDNLTVPVVEFIELGNWSFAVMQMWTEIWDGPKLISVGAYARFGDDLLKVKTLLPLSSRSTI